MTDIEGTITRIRHLRAYGLEVSEIREHIAPAPGEEGVFYLCFIAAQVMDAPPADEGKPS